MKYWHMLEQMNLKNIMPTEVNQYTKRQMLYDSTSMKYLE